MKEGLGSVPYFKEWIKGYSSFGVDLAKFKCSSEAIARSIIRCAVVNYQRLKHVGLQLGGSNDQK